MWPHENVDTDTWPRASPVHNLLPPRAANRLTAVAQKGSEIGKPSRGERELARESLIDETVSTLRIRRALKSEQENYTKTQTTRRKF